MHRWCVIVPLCLLPISATAATLVVSPSGSDSAPCMADAPCRTIRHGLDHLGSGAHLVPGQTSTATIAAATPPTPPAPRNLRVISLP